MAEQDTRKAEALAALTIATIGAIDRGDSIATLFGELAGSYDSPPSGGSNTHPSALAALIAREADISLGSLLDTARETWEAVKAERAESAESRRKKAG